MALVKVEYAGPFDGEDVAGHAIRHGDVIEIPEHQAKDNPWFRPVRPTPQPSPRVDVKADN